MTLSEKKIYLQAKTHIVLHKKIGCYLIIISVLFYYYILMVPPRTRAVAEIVRSMPIITFLIFFMFFLENWPKRA